MLPGIIALIQQDANGGEGLSARARLGLSTPELREAFTTLLGGIRLSVAFDSSKSILVTSAQPSEGKSTIASCLAITASLAGQSVLLIDGDLRRPWLPAAPGIVDGVGLGEFLGGQVEADAAIHQVDLLEDLHEVCRLAIMPAGRRSPAYLPALDWSKARASFRSLAERYDIVVLDSPPILAANDALLLGGIVDAVLLVVGAGCADRDDVLRAKQQLEPVSAPIIGAVLNRFDPHVHGKSTKPYRAYYSSGQR